MASYFSRRAVAVLNASSGLLMLQLGLRGLAVRLNESGGNTYDVAGDINGPKFFWLLVPESWTLDVATRFLFWVEDSIRLKFYSIEKARLV